MRCQTSMAPRMLPCLKLSRNWPIWSIWRWVRRVVLIIAYLTRCPELDTVHPTTLDHAHLTKLAVDVHSIAINVPSLVELTTLGETATVAITDCALKKLRVGTNVRTFMPTNVNWSTLEKLNWDGVSDTDYWLFVATHLPADVALKSLKCWGRQDFTFRAIKVRPLHRCLNWLDSQNKSLMPERVHFEWLQQNTISLDEPFVLPRELSLVEGPHNGLQGYQFIVNKFAAIECLDFSQCHDLSPEGLDVLFKGAFIWCSCWSLTPQPL